MYACKHWGRHTDIQREIGGERDRDRERKRDGRHLERVTSQCTYSGRHLVCFSGCQLDPIDAGTTLRCAYIVQILQAACVGTCVAHSRGVHMHVRRVDCE
eukprot:4341667-Pyramimonas_sp.AAC.1